MAKRTKSYFNLFDAEPGMEEAPADAAATATDDESQSITLERPFLGSAFDKSVFDLDPSAPPSVTRRPFSPFSAPAEPEEDNFVDGLLPDEEAEAPRTTEEAAEEIWPAAAEAEAVGAAEEEPAFAEAPVEEAEEESEEAVEESEPIEEEPAFAEAPVEEAEESEEAVEEAEPIEEEPAFAEAPVEEAEESEEAVEEAEPVEEEPAFTEAPVEEAEESEEAVEEAEPIEEEPAFAEAPVEEAEESEEAVEEAEPIEEEPAFTEAPVEEPEESEEAVEEAEPIEEEPAFAEAPVEEPEESEEAVEEAEPIEEAEPEIDEATLQSTYESIVKEIEDTEEEVFDTEAVNIAAATATADLLAEELASGSEENNEGPGEEADEENSEATFEEVPEEADEENSEATFEEVPEEADEEDSEEAFQEAVEEAFKEIDEEDNEEEPEITIEAEEEAAEIPSVSYSSDLTEDADAVDQMAGLLEEDVTKEIVSEQVADTVADTDEGDDIHSKMIAFADIKNKLDMEQFETPYLYKGKTSEHIRYRLSLPTQKKPRGKRIMRNVISWVLTFVIAIVLALLIRQFVFVLAAVDGPSMEPTLYTNERLLVTRYSYYFNEVEHGDVIVCKFPNPMYDKYYVKRVIAVGGESVSVQGGVVYVNGEALDEPYIKERPVEDMEEVIVPTGSVFVMGDNRNNSTDSRKSFIGPIEEKLIIGKARCVLFPFNQISSLE